MEGRRPLSSRINIFICLVCLLLCIPAWAQKTYLLADTTIVHRLDTNTSIFVDATDTISFEQIISPAIQQKFTSTHKSLTFGYLKPSLWIKLTTRTASPRTLWYLDIPAPFLEYVDFYQRNNDNTWKHSLAGYFRKQSLRDVPHTNQILPLHFNADSISTVYIKIAGNSPKTFPLFVIEKEKFTEQTRLDDLWYGIFFGILFVMFFYNLFIYLTLNQTNYLLYICTIVCTFCIFSAASGYAGRFLWPEYPFMNFFAGRLSLSVITIFLSIFTIRFLSVKKYSLVMYYILLSLTPLAVIAAILVISKAVSSAGNNLISISTIVYMVTGVVCRVKGNKTATYFIAAWTIYLIGGLLLTLRNSGVFDFNFWTTHFVEIGAMLETIIIAFALGDQYRRFKKEKEIAQQHALKIQLGATEKLEVKVRERTEQLSKAYEDLRATLETNTLQTRMIENKNAELDAFFYRISHDLKGPISTLLGLSALAKVDVKDEQAREYIDRQHQQVERLHHIVTGLINLTKLNHSELQKEKIDFDKTIEDCIDSFKTLPGYSAITFGKNIQPEIEFYSEWTLVNAILQNLIENSIKYAGKNSPYVNIGISREDEFIVITVEDNGQGIPKELQSKIFDMFFRATQNASGTGLGLYILKRSVERLHGTIHLNSELNAGSTFTIKLPANL